MKQTFNKKNIVGVLACLLLVLGSMDCWAESPVDKALDRDEEGLFYDPNSRGSRMKLRSVNLPASLKKVSATAFYKMTTLTEVLIPESLTEVEFDGKLEPDPNHPYGGLLTQTWAFLGTSLPLKTQARLKKLGYYGSFK